MAHQFDAHWFFDVESRLFDGFGQRIDVAGLPRWSQPSFPTLRHGNHAAVRAGEGLIPDQLVQVFDAQRREGATLRCIDIYGDRDERDELCEAMGLQLSEDSDLEVVLFDKSKMPLGVISEVGERTAPTPVQVSPAEWVDLAQAITHGNTPAWAMELVRAQAVIPEANFYAIRLGESVLASIARYDWDGLSQIASLYTEADFRKTGFARALLLQAIASSPNQQVIALHHARNRATVNLTERIGAETILRGVRRRYIGGWDQG